MDRTAACPRGDRARARVGRRRRPGLPLAALLGLAVLLAAAGPAAAKPWRPKFMENVELPRWDLSLGAGGNALVDSKLGNGGGAVLDFSLVHGTLWASLGFGVGFSDSTQFHAYAEAGVWAILNFGAGWGAVVERRSDCTGCAPSTGPHLFVGLPLGRQVYVEPYYRAHFLIVGRNSILHEVGLLLKYTTWKWIR